MCGWCKIYIRRLDCVSVPRDTKHPVATGLNDEFMMTLFLCFVWDDIFHTTVTSEATSYA